MSALVELYSKPGCHLCEVAKSEIISVKDELGFAFMEIDISNNPELMEKFGESIPVIFINGEFFARFALNRKSLKHRIISLN